MKKILLTLIALVVLFPLNGFAHGSDHIEYTPDTQHVEEDIIITIDGMTCEACVQTMTDIFSKEDSVHAVKAVLESQTITIDEKDNSTLSDDTIKKHIEWGGYDLITIKRAE